MSHTLVLCSGSTLPFQPPAPRKGGPTPASARDRSQGSPSTTYQYLTSPIIHFTVFITLQCIITSQIETKTRRDKKAVAKMLIRRHDMSWKRRTVSSMAAHERPAVPTNRCVSAHAIGNFFLCLRVLEVCLGPSLPYTLSILSPDSSGTYLNYRNDNKRLHV